MATSVGSLFLDLRASTENLSKDAAKAIQKARRIGNDLAKAVAAGAAVAGGALVVALTEANQRIDKLAKSSDRLGIPIEKLRALQEVADKAGVGIDETTAAMGDLQKQVFLAAAGSSKAGYAFRALGLDVKELKTLNPEAQFEKVATALDKVRNQTDRAGLATKLFGDAGAKMLAVMAGGADTIDQAGKKLDGLGVTISRIDAAKVEIANDAIGDLKLVAEGAANQLAVALAPAIRGIADLMTNAAMGSHGFRDQIINLVDNGVKGAGRLIDAWRGWQVIIKAGQLGILYVSQAITEFVKYGEIGLLGLASGFEKVFLGWQELAQYVKIAFFTVLTEIEGPVNKMFSTWNENVNILITGFNKISGLKVPPIEIPINTENFGAKLAEAQAKLVTLAESTGPATQAFAQSLKEMDVYQKSLADGTDAYSQSIEQTWAEMDTLLSKPLPSEQLDKWFADVKAKTTAEATAIAAAGTPKFDKINTAPLKELHGYLWDILTTSQMVFNSIEDVAKSLDKDIDGLVRGTMSWRDALNDVAASLVGSVIKSFIQMGAQFLAQQAAMFFGVQAMSNTAAASATATAASSAAAISASWMPAAIAASIATFGAASVEGTAAFVGALALGSAAGVAIGGIASVASGFVNTAGQAYGSGKAGGRASGGPVNAGNVYRVNENGQEFFRPSTNGEVVPLGKMEKEMTGGAGNSTTVHVTQSFASGVTRDELAQQAENVKKETLGAVLDGIRRGGVFRKGVHR